MSGCGLLSKGKEIVEDAITDEEGSNTDEEADAKGEETKDKSDENAELGDYEVFFGGDIEESEDKFIINGKSNLLPGSRIVGEVLLDEGKLFTPDTSELVGENGDFYMELDHHQYGEAEIVIRFDFDNVQDDEIKRHYGEKGQKLEGPFIYRHKAFDGILQKAEARINYDANGGSDLAIAAPDWEPLPDDYGDPRIWIEVDELTEDGEYFYMHGRSNILEGSVLKVEYQYNRGETQVNPDGTFDFKFDYEYLEDKDIIITFKPSGFQWNEIEEAYGKTGQKLVGNLVKTNKFNTNEQYVEKVIEWDSEKSEMKSGSVNQSRDQDEKTDEGSSDEEEKPEDEDKE